MSSSASRLQLRRLASLGSEHIQRRSWRPNDVHQKRWLGSDVSPGAGRMSDLSGLGPKRFYDKVDVQRGVIEKDGTKLETFTVTVDEKAVKTPKRHTLCTPSEAFSVAVASEWDAQEGRIRPSSMPLTGLACAALDIVPEFKTKIQTSVLRYVDTDTVCIRSDTPRELVDSQTAALAPVIDFVERSSGAKVNVVRGGAFAAVQPDKVKKWVDNVAHDLDDWSLVALDSSTSSAKSVFIAAALKMGAVSVDEAVKAARSEEHWQSKVWGVVEGGHDMDDADIMVRLSAANMVFRFIDMNKSTFDFASDGKLLN